jgi:acyl-CoA thioesterase-1
MQHDRLIAHKEYRLKFCIATILLGLTLIGPAQAQDPTKPTLLVTGDSLSAEYGIARGSGWVSLLVSRLKQEGSQWEIMNASISGETTSGGKTRLPNLLTKHQPAIVIIELGGNDALRGLPISSTESNLAEMTRLARNAGAKPLLLGMRMPPNYGQAYSEAFSGIYRSVAAAEKAALVPFFLEPIGNRLDYFQADRIHPTEQAQPLLLETVWPSVSRLITSRPDKK